MGQIDRIIAIGRLVDRIRRLERESPGTAVPQLCELLRDPATSRAALVPLLMALRRFGPAAAVVLPLVEKLTRPEEAERVRQLARSVIAAIRGGRGRSHPP